MENKEFYSVRKIADIIEGLVPSSTQEDWDNSGLIIGFEEKPVERIITCMDVSKAVVSEAVGRKADMIVSHHPLIFDGIKSVNNEDPSGKVIMELIGKGISIYSSHTPFDKVKGGNNDVLAKKIGLTSVKPMGDTDICRMGKLKKSMTLAQVIEELAQSLEMSLRGIRAVGELNREIAVIGICTGAGAEFLSLAKESGCDLLITGDVKYHEARRAEDMGICLIDAGHYHTEKIFAAAMKEKLEKKLDDSVEVIISEAEEDPFKIL